MRTRFPGTVWIAIGEHDGYYRAVVYPEDRSVPWSCSHRHPNSTRAKICARRNAERLDKVSSEPRNITGAARA